MISLVLLVPFLLYYKISPGPPLILLPTLVMVVAGLCFGFGCFVAATNVYFRDVQHLIGIVLQMGFFMTPIIYPLSAVATSRLSGAGPILKALVYANPFTWVATSLQDIIAYRRWPHHGVGLGYSAAIALALTLTGAWYFQRAQRRFAEEL
jgi:ABC-type polysaccharide/polyol phosphate export permease